METAGDGHTPGMGRELGVVHIPVMWGRMGVSHTCDGETALGCHIYVMERELGALTHL